MRRFQLFLVTALLAISCSLPWNTGTAERETNIAFTLRNNQIQLTSVTVGGHTGDFLLATAQRRSAIDSDFATRENLLSKKVVVRFGQRLKVALNPTSMSLHKLGDATIGADAFPHNAVTIDYAKQLVILRPAPDTSQMPRYPFAGAPTVPVIFNGTQTRAVVDTLVPDTMVVPASLVGNRSGRVTVSLSVGGIDFPEVDARVVDVEEIHLGNRLLANFLVTVDYRRGTVALWRDPRSGAIPLGESLR